jgi:hypothetical protein
VIFFDTIAIEVAVDCGYPANSALVATKSIVIAV